MKIKNLNIKENFEQDYFACVINDFFTKEECENFIMLAEKKGFTDVQKNKFGTEFLDKDFRTDKGVSFHNKKITDYIFEKINEIIQTSTLRLSETPTSVLQQIRFNKVSPGETCNGHMDDIITIGDEISKWSVIAYLNDSNGKTRLYNPANMKKIDVSPKCGTILLFDQRINHMGMSPDNIKYIMRVDLMTKKDSKPKNKSPRLDRLLQNPSGRARASRLFN